MDWICNTDPSYVVRQWIRFCWHTGKSKELNSFCELALAEVIRHHPWPWGIYGKALTNAKALVGVTRVAIKTLSLAQLKGRGFRLVILSWV